MVVVVIFVMDKIVWPQYAKLEKQAKACQLER